MRIPLTGNKRCRWHGACANALKRGASEPPKVHAGKGQLGGNDAVLVGSEYKKPADLKGKTVGLGEFSVSHFLLVMALTKNGMTARDVKIVRLSAGDAVAAFLSGRVDAATAGNPWAI